MPLISVVLPVYNGERYLRQSISSVLNQNLKDFELLIHDDASTDNTVEIVESFQDTRIKFYKGTKNKGIFAGINKLILETQSPYVHLWSQDDIMCPDCLEEFYEFHSLNREVAFSFSSSYSIDEKDRVLKSGPDDGINFTIEPKDAIPLFLVYGCMPGNISRVVVNKELVLKEGLFREDLAFIGDFDMWVRLSSKYPMGRIRKRLQKIRNHSQQASKRDDMYLKKLEETIYLFDKQVKLLRDDQKEDGLRLIKWIHHPHFTLISLNFIKSLKFRQFLNYNRSLGLLGNIFTIYCRTFVYLFIKQIGFHSNYKNYLNKPFFSSVERLQKPYNNLMDYN